MFRRVRLFLSMITIPCAACVPALHDPATPSAATRSASNVRVQLNPDSRAPRDTDDDAAALVPRLHIPMGLGHFL